MKANLKTIVAMVFVLMLLIVFIWPACSSPSRYILGVPITHKEKMSDQALKIQLTRGEIKNMYRLIALGATPENDSLGADPWGNEYHYIVIPGKYDAPPSPILMATCGENLFVPYTNAHNMVAGKALQMQEGIVFIWSNGPNGRNDSAQVDDVTLK